MYIGSRGHVTSNKDKVSSIGLRTTTAIGKFNELAGV